jgi:hypothetical protein
MFASSLPLLLALVAIGPRVASGSATQPATQPTFEIGHLDAAEIRESSGIVASRKYPGVFWTHNDSGNAPVLYAVTREGKLVAQFPVRVANRDWEDIAIDDAGHLYIGEIGNNERHWPQIAVYQVDEPDPTTPAPKNGSREALLVRRNWQLRFPQNRPFDAEALFVHDGWGYIISKLLDGERATLYRFRLVDDPKIPAGLEPVTRLPIHAPVTAADLSPDASELAVMSIAGPYLFRIDGDIARAGKVAPRYVPFFQVDMEAVCFVPEGLLATTESRAMLLFTHEMFDRFNKSDDGSAKH